MQSPTVSTSQGSLSLLSLRMDHGKMRSNIMLRARGRPKTHDVKTICRRMSPPADRIPRILCLRLRSSRTFVVLVHAIVDRISNLEVLLTYIPTLTLTNYSCSNFAHRKIVPKTDDFVFKSTIYLDNYMIKLIVTK